MKHLLVKKYGTLIGLAAFAAMLTFSMFIPSSCSLTPEQRQQLQAISVPAAGILSKAAVAQGWVAPGDEITIKRGVAVVMNNERTETKIFQLAELGLDHAIDRGLLTPADTVTVDTPTQLTITSPANGVLTPAAAETLPVIAPGELLPKPSPPPGG